MEVITSSDFVGKPINRLLIEAKYGSNKAKISTKNHVKLFAVIPILSKISMVLDAEIKIGRFDKWHFTLRIYTVLSLQLTCILWRTNKNGHKYDHKVYEAFSQYNKIPYMVNIVWIGSMAVRRHS